MYLQQISSKKKSKNEQIFTSKEKNVALPKNFLEIALYKKSAKTKQRFILKEKTLL